MDLLMVTSSLFLLTRTASERRLPCAPPELGSSYQQFVSRLYCPTASINLIGAVLEKNIHGVCIRKPVDLLSVSAQICNTPWCLWVTFRRPLSKLGSSCLGLSSPIRAQGIWDMQECSAWSHEAVTVRLWCSTLMPLFSNGIQEAWLTADYNILGGTIFHV